MTTALSQDLFAPGAVTEAQLQATFASEPLWLMRTARLTAERGRAPIAPVTVAARHQAESVRQLDAVPLRQELTALLVAEHPDLALQWLHDSGMLAILIPEIEATVSFTQEAGRKHKDVWQHTKQVVKQAPPNEAVRWAALLHDIGKVPTRTFTEEGKVHFHGHAEVGARMFGPVARRFGFEKTMRHEIRFLILHHLRANQYDSSWTDSAVRRFSREMERHLDELLALSRADVTSKRAERRQRAWRNIDDLRARIEALREEDAKLPPLPTGLGNLLMEHYSRPAGRWIADIKRELEAAIETGTLEQRQDSAYYVKWLQQEGIEPK